jgi:hypothetical protein
MFIQYGLQNVLSKQSYVHNGQIMDIFFNKTIEQLQFLSCYRKALTFYQFRTKKVLTPSTSFLYTNWFFFMKKLTLLFATLSLVVLTSRCTFADDIDKLTELATDSLSIVLGTPVFDTGLQLEIKNAKTNDYIEDAEVTVAVSGKDAAIVYNNLGIKSGTYKTKLGLMHLILDPTKTDSAAMLTTPKEFDLHISAQGYTSVTQRVQFNQKKMRLLTVSLVKLNDAPEGVVVASAPGFASSGATGSTTTTGTLALNGGEQQLKLEPGVVLRDASGAAVTGTVAANVVYYDPTADNANTVFPGGLNANVKFADNSKEMVRFEPIGLFNIKLTAGGKNVKTFSNGGLTIKTEIPAGTINPSTNQPVKVNDEIGMWSRDEGSGEWSFEKNAKVKSAGGKLYVEESVSHLSDHLYSYYYDYCHIQVKVNFSGSAAAYNSSDYYFSDTYVYFYLVDDLGREEMVDLGYLLINYDGTIANPQVYGFLNVYRNFTKVKIVPASVSFRKLTFSQTLFDISANCENMQVNITISEPPAPNPKENVTFNLMVTSGQLTVKPNMEIKYRETGSGSSYSSAYLTNGTGNMSISLNTDYDIVVTLGGNQGKAKMRIESISSNRYKVTISGLSLGDETNNTPIVIEATKAPNGSINVVYNVEVSADVLNQLM